MAEKHNFTVNEDNGGSVWAEEQGVRLSSSREESGAVKTTIQVFDGSKNEPYVTVRATVEAFRLERAFPWVAEVRDGEFRMLLNLAMCSDPTPFSADEDQLLAGMLDRLAQARGYENWTVAYHEHGKGKE